MPPVWTDRRMIGRVFHANYASRSVSNPRGWLSNSSLDALTPATFRTAMLAAVATDISVITGMGAQAVIFWDLEGAQYPHPGGGSQAISYIGSPDRLADFAPEMDTIADELFALYAAAGLEVGVTLRPTILRVAVGSGNWYHDFADTLDEAVDNLHDKITYAQNRWGATLFYVDTPVWAPGSNDGPYTTMSAAGWDALYALHPDVLIAPERVGGAGQSNAWFDSTAPYGEGRLGYRQSPDEVRPGFSLIALTDADLDTEVKRAAYVRGVSFGDIPIFSGWFNNQPENGKILVIYTEGAALYGGSGGGGDEEEPTRTLTNVLIETAAGGVGVTGDPPLAVASLSAVATDATTIRVTFTEQASGKGYGYRLAYSDDGGSVWQTIATILRNSPLLYDHTGRSQLVGYRYRITPYNTFGSGPSTSTTEVFTTVPVAPPVAAFTGSPLTGNAPLLIALVNQSQNGPFTAINWSASNGWTSTETNPTLPGTATGQISVTLTVTNAGGTNSLTKVNYITVTPPIPPPDPEDPSACDPPAFVWAQAFGGMVRVNWASVFGATTYKVHRGSTADFVPSALNLIHAETTGLTVYRDTGVTNGTPYYYKVVAANSVGDSPAALARDHELVTESLPTTPADGPDESEAFSDIIAWWDFEQASDGTTQVNEPNKYPHHTQTINDDGSAKCPRVAGPNGTYARQVASTGSFRLGSTKTAAPGYRGFTLAAKIQWTGDRYAFGCYDSLDWEWLFDRVGTTARLRWRLPDLTTASLSVTGGGVTGEWVTVAMVFDPPNGTVKAKVIRASGTVLTASGSISTAGVYYSKRAKYIGARSASNGLNGPVAFACDFRRALTDAELVRLNSIDLYSQARFLPPADPGTPPFSSLTGHGQIFNPEDLGCQGGYYYRVVRMPSGDLRAFWSTDHYDGNVLPDPQGVWVSEALADWGSTPTTKTLIVPYTHTVPTGINGNTDPAGEQAETPWFVYNPDDPTHKFWVYHQQLLTKSGIANSQQTTLAKFTDETFNTATRVYYGVSHPNGVDANGQQQNHTGYQKVYRPGHFPGVDPALWLSYGINNTDGTIVLSTCTDGVSFKPAVVGQYKVIDTTSAFGWRLTQWVDGMFVRNGRIFAVGKGRYPQSPGVTTVSVVMVEIGLDANSLPTKVIGGPWELTHGTGPYPGLGFIVEDKLEYDATTGIVHLWVARGSYAEDGVIADRDQVIDYYTLQMEV